jgi:hypothetical protein
LIKVSQTVAERRHRHLMAGRKERSKPGN